MFPQNSFCDACPGLGLHVVDERSDAGRRHVINHNIRFGGVALKEGLKLVSLGHSLRILDAHATPKEKVASSFLQSDECLSGPLQQSAVGIHEGEVNIDEHVGVLHSGNHTENGRAAEEEVSL